MTFNKLFTTFLAIIFILNLSLLVTVILLQLLGKPILIDADPNWCNYCHDNVCTEMNCTPQHLILSKSALPLFTILLIIIFTSISSIFLFVYNLIKLKKK